jgi:hypothetical protein
VPTDIVAAVKRRRETRKQRKATIAILGACLIICLINIMLLFIDRSLAQALDLWAGPGSAHLLCGSQTALCSRPSAR